MFEFYPPRRHVVLNIEIITDNTREGIVILIQLRKGNAVIGGQIQVPDTVTIEPAYRKYSFCT
jgi:hypothetical protein